MVSCGAGESLLNALLMLIDPGDRVLLTNPTYSGMAQRVRLAGGVQAFAPLVVSGGRWSLDLDALGARRAAAASSSSPRRACRWARCSPPRRPRRSSAGGRENDAWIVFNGHADKVAFDGREVTHPRPARAHDPGRLHVQEPPDARLAHRLGGRAARGHGRDGGRPHLQRRDAERLLPGRRRRRAGGPQDWQAEAVETYARGQRALLDAIAASDRLSAMPAEGGYYCLLDTGAPALRATEFAARLLAEEQVAVTPMQGWGSDDFGEYLVRLIFTNKPEDRLREAGGGSSAGRPAHIRPGRAVVGAWTSNSTAASRSSPAPPRASAWPSRGPCTRRARTWSPRPAPARRTLEDILHVPADLMDPDAPAEVIARAVETYGGRRHPGQQRRRPAARRPAPARRAS